MTRWPEPVRRTQMGGIETTVAVAWGERRLGRGDQSRLRGLGNLQDSSRSSDSVTPGNAWCAAMKVSECNRQPFLPCNQSGWTSLSGTSCLRSNTRSQQAANSTLPHPLSHVRGDRCSDGSRTEEWSEQKGPTVHTGSFLGCLCLTGPQRLGERHRYRWAVFCFMFYLIV